MPGAQTTPPAKDAATAECESLGCALGWNVRSDIWSFWIAARPVTIGEWRACVEAGECLTRPPEGAAEDESLQAVETS
jgi:hypothetical protein